MKEFNGEKFCKDIIELRGTDSQSAFAEKLGINRSTLSLLENGNRFQHLNFLTNCVLWRQKVRRNILKKQQRIP